MADAVVERGASRELSFLLPPTLRLDELRTMVERIRTRARDLGVPPGQIGVIKDVWVTTGQQRERTAYLDRLAQTYREYGVWWVVGGAWRAPSRPERYAKQVERAVSNAIVGPPAQVVAELDALRDAGVQLVVAHLHRDWTRGSPFVTAVEHLASHTLPEFGGGRQ